MSVTFFLRAILWPSVENIEQVGFTHLGYLWNFRLVFIAQCALALFALIVYPLIIGYADRLSIIVFCWFAMSSTITLYKWEVAIQQINEALKELLALSSKDREKNMEAMDEDSEKKIV